MNRRELYALPIRQHPEPITDDEAAARQLAPLIIAWLAPAPANMAEILAALPPHVIARAKTLALAARADLPRPASTAPAEALPGLEDQQRLPL